MQVCRLAVSSFFAVLTAFAAPPSSTVNISITNQVNTTAGVKGRLQMAMSTSFQLATWSYNFFNQAPQALPMLNGLAPEHTRLQVTPQANPLTAPGVWDFSQLDSLLAPIQNAADHNLEFQIGGAPAFLNDSNGHILPGSFADFVTLSARLVQYYNTGGFDASGHHFQSSSPYPITWWGVFNEPNGNGLTPQQYVNLYNLTASAMASADPSIKFAALELSDWNQAAEAYLPTFVSNVTAPVNALATHFYSSCNHADTDNTLFPTALNFASDVSYIYSQLATRPNLANVPVWVTENNVNADYDAGNGTSFCNGTPFVADPRGTSAFFAAWRSLVFELLGEAGTQALYHWTFSGPQQYGETDGAANPYLSYWVDYYLSHWLPSPPGQDILQTNAVGCCLWISNVGGVLGLDTHTLALRNVDGSVVIVMSNHAVAKPLTDNNGPGLSRTFALDLSALGPFRSATLVTFDASTPAGGPVPQPLTAAAQMQVTLPGYGAALLRLANATPMLTSVVNAASYSSGTVAPGEIVALFGNAVGPSQPAGGAFTNPRLVADSLQGLHVYFDGVPAPILYASAGQINTVVPFSVAGHSTTTVQVNYLGVSSPAVTIPVAPTAAGVFVLDGSGRGPAAVLNARDGSVNSSANPARRGDWVSIFATGAGATTPASFDGLLGATPLPQPNARVSVTMGGIPCQIEYAGAAPGLVAGALQINAQIPAGAPSGPKVPLQITVGNSASQAGVTLAVQ
ncbi:MAG TPA: hypothetical protein VKX49_06480 [Bryobacteraceae bacterium]|nr:hypothetical protein [Bryobacteraceae bacterium]